MGCCFFWAGYIYQYLGLTFEAIQLWETLLELNPHDLTTQNYLSFIRNQQYSRILYETDLPYYITNTLSVESPLRGKPLSMRLTPNHQSFLVTFFDIGKIFHYDLNGEFLSTLAPSPQRLLSSPSLVNPFDLIAHEEGFLISDYTQNHLVQVDAKLHPSRVIPLPRCLGPQFIASDEENALYVSCFGTRNILKLGTSGEVLFAFGEKTVKFSGLKNPTGLAVAENFLYVADRSPTSLEVFTLDGLHLRSLVVPVEAPLEDIAVYYVGGQPYLYLLTHTSLYSYNLSTNRLNKLHHEPQAHYTSLSKDPNQQVYLVDHLKGQIVILNTTQRLLRSYYPRIQSILEQEDRSLLVDVIVQDWNGDPVSGLTEKNFSFSSELGPLQTHVIMDDLHHGASAILLVINPFSAFLNQVLQTVDSLVNNLQQQAPQTTIYYTMVTENPTFHPYQGLDKLQQYAAVARKLPQGTLGETLYVSGSSLPREAPKTAIVVLSDVATTKVQLDPDFQVHDPILLNSFFSTNQISLHTVYFQNPVNSTLQDLSENSGGQVVYYQTVDDLRNFTQTMLTQRFGFYRLLLEHPNIRISDAIEGYLRQGYLTLDMEVMRNRLGGHFALQYLIY